MTLVLGQLRRIGDFDDSYVLLQSDIDVNGMLDLYEPSITDDSPIRDDEGNYRYNHLLVKVESGEVLEIWGIVGIPYLNEAATLIVAKELKN